MTKAQLKMKLWFFWWKFKDYLKDVVGVSVLTILLNIGLAALFPGTFHKMTWGLVLFSFGFIATLEGLWRLLPHWAFRIFWWGMMFCFVVVSFIANYPTLKCWITGSVCP